MLYIVGGFSLALLAVLAGIPFVAVLDPLGFPDIRLVCRALVVSGGECANGAMQAGLVSVAGMSVAALVAVGIQPVRARPALPIRHDIVLPLAIAAVAVLVAFAALRSPGAPFASREQEITAGAALVSIVNLGWPLLVQLAALAPRIDIRIGYLAALATLLCLSPFRAALVSVAVFGVVLPLLEPVVRRAALTGAFELRRLALGLAGVVLAGCLVAAIVVSQTAERVLTVSDIAPADSLVETPFGKLQQRLSYPLYQAYFAAAAAEVQALPTAEQEIAAKFRLGTSHSLNHYLYTKIYNRETVGEMTSLYYGEAAARTSLPPLFWVIAAPLLYVLAWLLLRRLGVDVGVLAGLAIWRGSLGGAFSVFPAFVIQALVMLCLTRLAPARHGVPAAPA